MGNEILKRINEKESVKILVTVDENNLPHPVVKDSLHSDGEHIIYTEFIESSKTNRYMTKSLWFDKPVSILLLTNDERSYTITAQPHRAIVNGKEFQKYYESVQKQYGDFDLSTVWVLKPLEIVEQSLHVRVKEEENKRPYFLHLDRLAKEKQERL